MHAAVELRCPEGRAREVVVAPEVTRAPAGRAEVGLPFVARRDEVARSELRRRAAGLATVLGLEPRRRPGAEVIRARGHGEAILRERFRLPGFEGRPGGEALAAGLRTALGEPGTVLRSAGREVAVMVMKGLRRTVPRSGVVTTLIIATLIVLRAWRLWRLGWAVAAGVFAGFGAVTTIAVLKFASFGAAIAFGARVVRTRVAAVSGARVARRLLLATRAFARFGGAALALLRRAAFEPAFAFPAKLIGPRFGAVFGAGAALQAIVFEPGLVALAAARWHFAGGTEFIEADFAIAIAVEFPQHIGGLAHFLGVDDPVVIGVEGGKDSGHGA